MGCHSVLDLGDSHRDSNSQGVLHETETHSQGMLHETETQLHRHGKVNGVIKLLVWLIKQS